MTLYQQLKERAFKEFLRKILKEYMELAQGNRSQAARLLGIDRRNLSRLYAQAGMEMPAVENKEASNFNFRRGPKKNYGTE